MKNIVIFEKIKDQLYSASFDPDGEDELDRAFSFWSDGEHLRSFFNNYRSDLRYFDPMKKVRHAAADVATETELIHDALFRNRSDSLSTLFKPLDNREANIRYNLQKLKMSGQKRKSMLRLYALSHNDSIVVAGSAIKLTEKMDRPHLRTELHKLDLVKQYLEDGGRNVNYIYMDLKS